MATDEPDQTRREMQGPSTLPIPGSTLRPGDQGPEVERLYEYLSRFGYFPNSEIRQANLLWRPAEPFAPDDPARYDARMESAVRQFQLQNALDPTGVVDDATLALIRLPRCGFPDLPITTPGGAVATFVAQGNRWPTNSVTYSFDNSTPDLTVAAQRAAIRGALDRWAAVTPLTFRENAGGGDIRVSWRAGDHGDGSPFDGPSGILAHCFYPPPNGGDIAGDCHFDEAETWSVNTPPSGIDLPTVALHELGHGLGLAHSADPAAVMYAYYGGPRRELTADDIQGIESIYGSRDRWASLGGAILAPVAARNRDGRLEVFARGTDGALWHIWQTAPSNGWSGWASLGGAISAPITVCLNADGRLEVFARGSDGALWNKWQVAPGGAWSGWNSLAGSIADPVVARNADGRLEVFARAGSNALWHRWQLTPGGTWSAWANLGGTLGGRAAVAANADGRLEAFARGTNGVVRHTWQTAPGGGWSAWAALGGSIVGAPTVARNADGRLEIFGKGTDNGLWHAWQTAPSGGWSAWAPLGGVASNPVAMANADGRLEVFARGSDNRIWHIWQTAPSNGWSGWASLGGQAIQGPTVGRNKDGRLEIFVRSTDGALWHAWQNVPNGGWR